MRTAVAELHPPHSPVTPLAIIVANAAHPEIVGPHLARILRSTYAAAAVRGIDELAAERPEAVVLAVYSDLSRGLAVLRRIHKATPATPVVVVASDDSATAARQALNAGAAAYIRDADAAQALAPALAAVMADLVCVPRASRRAIAKPTFSHREKEVLGLLVEGMTNRQIAARLYLAESTVKTHLASAFSKLGVSSRKEAATVLLDPAEGLVTTALPPAAPISLQRVAPIESAHG